MAVAVQPNPSVLEPKEIMELANKRTKRFGDRDAMYDLLLLYYYGRQPGDDSLAILGQSAAGRPLLRDLEKMKERGEVYSSQRLSPIVDDYQALVGRMPNSRVEPPDPSPEGEAKAEKLTKYLISTHEISDMDRQQADAGFHLPGLGDTCYVLTPDGDPGSRYYKRVVWEVVNPRTAYPEFYRGHRRFQVRDLIIRTEEEPDSIHALYGFWPRTKGRADCLVTLYISAFQRTTVIGTENWKEGPHAEWDLGFCPAQWVYNKVNGRYAQSDIAQSLAQQDLMDFTDQILADGLVRNVYGRLVGIENPQNMGQNQIVLGPNAPPVMFQTGGKFSVVDIAGDPTPALKMKEQALADLNATTGTSQVRQEGQMHGSIQTGRAIHAAQGPQSTRIDLKQQNLGAAIRNANAMTLEMQERAPAIGNHEFEIFGRYKGKSFRETMSGKDIDGWYRTQVSWDALVGMNIQQKAQVATEMVMAELTDDLGARELVGVEDPLGMRERITNMKIHKAQDEAKVQAILAGQQAPGGGAPPPAGAPGGPEGGAPATPAPPVFRPPGLMNRPGPAPAGANPLGLSRKKAEDALAAVASKLKGSVWALGELALAGTAQRPQLAVSDWKDQPLVMQTLKPLAAGVQVKATPENKLPPEAVRLA